MQTKKLVYGLRKRSKWKTACSIFLASLLLVSSQIGTAHAEDTNGGIITKHAPRSVPIAQQISIDSQDSREIGPTTFITGNERIETATNRTLSASITAEEAYLTADIGIGDYKIDPLTDAQINGSRWSKVSYTVGASGTPANRIGIPNLYTKVKPVNATQYDPETSLIEGLQNWEMWVHVGRTAYKITGSDLNPNSTFLTKTLKKTATEINRMAINAAEADLLSATSGSYVSVLADNAFEAFDYRTRMSDDIFAQIKAHKLRADKARTALKASNSWTSAEEESYQKIIKYYTNLERQYNNIKSQDYTPNYSEDNGTNLTTADRGSLTSTYSKLPFKALNTFSNLNVVSQDNPVSKKGGVLGWATNFREIYLNGYYNNYQKTLLHELGHEIDYASSTYSYGTIDKMLSKTPEFDKVWKTYFNDAPAYFRNTRAEAFAEGFARYAEYKYMGRQFIDGQDYYDREIYDYFDALATKLFADDNATKQAKLNNMFAGIIKPGMNVFERNGKYYAEDSSISSSVRTLKLGNNSITIYGTKPAVKTRTYGTKTWVFTTRYFYDFSSQSYKSATLINTQ